MGLKAQLLVQAETYTSMQGVNTQGTSDDGGGLNVGWIDNGDWMQYNVNIPVAGSYIVSLRVASLSGGGVLNVSSGATSIGDINVTSTGGWQTWSKISGTAMTFAKGEQTIKLKATKGGFNLNWFEFKLVEPLDANPPKAPVILSQSADVHSVALVWTASTDAENSLAGYKIFDGDKFLAFTTDTVFSLSKLSPNKQFNLSVYACDLSGNLSQPAQVSIATTDITWPLAWSDEFDGSSVDVTKWKYETGGGGWGNGEAEYYTSGANSSVKDGHLIIEARKETIGSNQYTSSRMNSQSAFDFMYGRVEVRAKLPKTKGTWPAIWCLPTNWVYGNWPECGEIDIMEHTGNNYGSVFGTVHTGAYNSVEGTQKSGGTTFTDVADTFHTYTLEWYPDRLDWYYDNNIVFSFANEYKTFQEWPYDIKFHLILNVAVGGGLGGTIDGTAANWPQQMVVDYVRVYNFNIGQNDTQAPTAPTNLVATPGGVTVDLSWTKSTDNQYVKRYYIYKGDALIDSTSGSSITLKGLDPLTSYTFDVVAKDFAGNASGKASVTTTTTDVKSFAVPGKFQAEDYIYMSGVQTETCTDAGGGLNVAYINPKDWMEYSIDVAKAGKYYLETRVAAQSLKGSFQLIDKDGNVLTTVATPSTGAWQTWKTVISNGFNLNAGVQRITIKSLAVDFNLNWFNITADSTQTNTAIDNGAATPSDRIYPNPTSGGSLNIELGESAAKVEVCIAATDGKVVYTNTFSNAGNKISISNLNLNAGIYIVNIKRGSSITHHKLLVK
jgi:beta-glucanase (GH16 family)